jgi:hypothetical protein
MASRHKDFMPGVPLPSSAQKELQKAGFEPGYPVFGLPYDRDPEQFHRIMHALTFLKPGGYSDLQPTLSLHFLIGDQPSDGQLRVIQVEVKTICRTWGGQDGFWRIEATWRNPDKRWYIDRKTVVICRVHGWLGVEGYVQFVPTGTLGQPLVVAGEDFRWGGVASRTLPPPKDSLH